jgi:Extensin-like protein C-terminus
VKLLVGLLAAASAVVAPSAASAFSPYLVVPDPRVAEASPAYRYANMSDADAYAAVAHRGILFQRVESAPGVRAPMRLTSRLHGVYVHSALPPEQRVTSPFEILDARLALALDDFCALLEHHDVDELVHFTMYRPNVAPPHASSHASPRPAHGRPKSGVETRKGLPRKVAKREMPTPIVHATTWAAPGTRHPAGLAIDVAKVHKRDGRWLSVQGDYHGRLGAKTCGEGAAMPEAAEARELHALVCESSIRGTFTYVLTPNYDATHADHFHMEIKPGVRWFLYN